MLAAPTTQHESLFSLSSRVALVTGGGTGLGAALAQGLAEAGASVVVAGRRVEPLEQTASRINAALGKQACWPLQCDVADLDAAGSIVQRATDLAGGSPVTLLINNAGVNVRQPAADLTAAHWRQSLDLMLAAPFFLARAAAPGMSREGYGRIITTASLQSSLAFPNSIPYAAAKSGGLGLTRALAEAYSPAYGYEGITCNAIAPGFVRTELTEEAVFGDDSLAARLAARTIARRNSVPSDLVGACVFLCSPASAYVNAQTLYVDGGFTALGSCTPPATRGE
jgi:NAD(P)-dependent dehydrogenase (short-subunit alcohol dehydrogenase family)